MTPESNGEGGPFEELINKAIWVVGGRPVVQDVLWLRGCRIPAKCFSPGEPLALFCATEGWVIWLLHTSSELILGQNTVWATFDHVLLLLIILEQKNHIPSKDKIIILSMSHRPRGTSSSLQHQPPLTFSYSATEGLPAPYFLSIAPHPLSANCCSAFRPLKSFSESPPPPPPPRLSCMPPYALDLLHHGS